MNGDIWILGISMTKFGKRPDRDSVGLGVDAATTALADAGVGVADIDVMAAGNLLDNPGYGQAVQKQLGQTGIPVFNFAMLPPLADRGAHRIDDHHIRHVHLAAPII